MVWGLLMLICDFVFACLGLIWGCLEVGCSVGVCGFPVRGVVDVCDLFKILMF